MPTTKHASMLARTITVSLLFATAGCSTQGATSPEEPTGTAVFQELYDQGIDRYFGVFTPATSQALPNSTIQYGFSGAGAPLCYSGQPFSVFTRDGSGNDLLIFTQAGGVCGPRGCAAVPVGLPLFPIGILDPNDPRNPEAAFDVGYILSCDGCFMMGDAAVDSDGDGAVQAALPLGTNASCPCRLDQGRAGQHPCLHRRTTSFRSAS